ncbi:uncharacterized protein LOC129612369 isoform X2 [Condylostylus longicornis]|uniref:uncharacterized protein LOC129612369 isoform X2 n=1 Tax=Condylostylus longicornis TaxID=2530218 RepID=UPI00244DD7C7|nr:uncharacterized protein LOC129612369 isoform X2 [Condylostylus longicornis]
MSGMEMEIIEISSTNSEILGDDNMKEIELEKLSSLSRSRHSLNLYDLGVCGIKSEAEKDSQIMYDTILRKEIDQWRDLLKSTKERIKTNENATLELKEEILTKEHIDHINQRPNFENFLKGFEEFNIKCYNFFEIYEKTLDDQKNLIKEYQDVIKKDTLVNYMWEI